MDSQLTLVDARSSVAEKNIVFIFDRSDMRNTALRIRGKNVPSYVVNTTGSKTTIHAEHHLLATVNRRLFRPDQLVFPGCRPISLGSWLKASPLWTLPLVFHAFGRRFEWRENIAGQLVLRESSRSGDIVAWFSKCHRWHGDHVLHAAHLTIRPELSEMRDMIVLSCMLAEHKLRALSKAQPAMCNMPVFI